MSNAIATPPSRWQNFVAASLRAFHAYGGWLVGITWWRFFVLSVLLLITTAILQSSLPRTTTTEVVQGPDLPAPPARPTPAAKPPAPPKIPSIRIEKPGKHEDGPQGGVSISIDSHGVRITPNPAPSASAPAASAPALPGVDIRLPPGATTREVLDAVASAKAEIEDAIRQAAEEAAAEAASEAAEASHASTPAADVPARTKVITRTLGVESALTNLAFIFIAASAMLKITYKRTVQAEVRAAQATETAEAESLKRQVVEARMAAMQAQVEPHFLFNTLASIDHLIEVDPGRASRMQKNLIALLRAAMPTMREANGESGGLRDLGGELAVIRPYLEILKVRMEERLATEVRVPEGLNSAEFPPMMLQSLVENAIKHGLEPKPEGGRLTVAAEILHGKLAVTVADTGLGFGKAATAGTGIGLSNIRERLALLYGHRAALAVAENPGGGTVVTITLPYSVRTNTGASA